ncbi:MAG TPA: hypothetical protein VF276_14540 [Chloroflexia bacterium]
MPRAPGWPGRPGAAYPHSGQTRQADGNAPPLVQSPIERQRSREVCLRHTVVSLVSLRGRNKAETAQGYGLPEAIALGWHGRQTCFKMRLGLRIVLLREGDQTQPDDWLGRHQ